MKTPDQKAETEKIVLTALLAALVIVLQLFGSAVHFGPFSISLVLLPIVLGAALCGPWAGAFLGGVFGTVVLLSGDAAPFLAISIPGTIATVLVKGIACGLVAGLVYRAFSRKNRYLAAGAAAFVCPVVNTGVFLLGCVCFFFDAVAAWGVDAGATSTVQYLLVGFVGVNFIIELALNVVLIPVLVRLIDLAGKRRRA